MENAFGLQTALAGRNFVISPNKGVTVTLEAIGSFFFHFVKNLWFKQHIQVSDQSAFKKSKKKVIS